MKEMEDNVLIAEFMGYTFSKSGLTARIGKGKKPSAYRLSDLHYNTSWNLLMPVVEKISNMAVWDDDLNSYGCEYDRVLYKYIDTDIKSLYTCVVSFIKWYNTHLLTDKEQKI